MIGQIDRGGSPIRVFAGYDNLEFEPFTLWRNPDITIFGESKFLECRGRRGSVGRVRIECGKRVCIQPLFDYLINHTAHVFLWLP